MSDTPKPNAPIFVTGTEPVQVAASIAPVQQITALIQREQWVGNFPHPDICQQYEAMLPGAFSRIVKMAEEVQSANIRTVEENNRFVARDNARGQTLGAIVCGLAIIGSVVCALTGHDAVAGALVSIPVIGVALALVSGKKK